MIDDCEPASVWRESHPKARKDYRCNECGRTIKAGERYHYVFMIHDGEGSTNRACEHCSVARSWLVVHCGGWVTGMLREELHEHYHERYREDGLSRLLVGIKHKWLRFDGSGLMKLPPRIPARASDVEAAQA